MFKRKNKRVNKLLEQVEKMSDEEILEREKELYISSGIRVVGGLGIFAICLVVFFFMIPYL